jgi:hypothetical protein
MVSHEFCYNCTERQKETIRFRGNYERGAFIPVEYCRSLGTVLTEEIKGVAFLLDCKFRRTLEMEG